MLYKQKDVLSVFEKFHPKKRKKLKLCVYKIALCTKKNLHAKIFLEIVFLTKKFILRLKKNWGTFETNLNNFCCRYQKMLVIEFLYVKVV